MGSFLVQVWEPKRKRWRTICLYYTRSAAEDCERIYRSQGYTVRVV